tara:strand:- start:580 stop:1428 length:849 start_codon:yes stop_codon:yes gene_type:complete
MKIKHNKYKNTGILFELLVRKLTSDTLNENASAAAGLVKKFFTKTELAKENKLYQTINSTVNISESKAEGIISSILEISKKLDKDQLKKDKYNLIKEIKNNFDINDFFKAQIKDYKKLASTYILFESYSNPKVLNPELIISSRINLLECLTSQPDAKMSLTPLVEELTKLDKGTRAVAYKIMLEKFNDRFKSLTTEQKEVLRTYINSASNAPKLKTFINKKFTTILEDLSSTVNKVKDPATVIKIQEVIKLVTPIIESKSIKDDHLVALLQYMELSKEMKSL